MQKYSTKGRGFLAFLFMLLGALIMITLVISFNKGTQEKKQIVKKELRHIKPSKTQKKATKPKPKPKAKPTKAQPKAPLPNINSLLGGIAMDIPEFITDDIAGDASQLLEDIAEDTIMNANTVDIKPKVLSRPPLEYPSQALKDGIKGYVVINMVITKEGTVELTKVLDAQPKGVFEDAALNAVQNWRFSPAKYKNKPVKIWVKQTIRFQ